MEMLLSQKTQGSSIFAWEQKKEGSSNVFGMLLLRFGALRSSTKLSIARICLGLLCCAAMGTPSALHAQTTHNITISWTYTQSTDLAVGFNVYRATVSGGPYSKQTTSPLPIATLSYIDTNGVGGTKYFYVVTAIDGSGVESVNSGEVSATFLASSPNAPTGVTAIAK